MLEYVKIENYRSLANVQLEMRPLTVLIGPNGGGKSNFLDALLLLAQGANGDLARGVERRFGMQSLVYEGAEPSFRKIFLELRFGTEGVFNEERAPVSYKLQLSEDEFAAKVSYEQLSKEPAPPAYSLTLMHRKGSACDFRSVLTGAKETESKRIEHADELAIYQVRDQTAYPTPYKLLRQLQDWAFYHPLDVLPDSPIRAPQLTRAGTRLSRSGENLASVLYAIQQQHPTTWQEINEYLQAICPAFRHMTFPPEGGDGKIVLRWWEHPFERQRGFSANLLSDGTMRFLALLAVLKSPDPPPLICIDEPEAGLHPAWVAAVGELLRAASANTQVVVSTHSPELVSSVDPESVVVVEKEDGSTILERLSAGELEGWLDEFRLGDLWLSGQVGG